MLKLKIGTDKMDWIKKNAVTLIIILLSASFSVATAYQILISDIKILGTFAQETRKIVVNHIEETKGEPLSEMQLQNKVENMEDDVVDHELKLNNHEEVINRLVISEAVQQVQNTVILKQLEAISKKLDEE